MVSPLTGSEECTARRRLTDAVEEGLEHDGPAADTGQHSLHSGEAEDIDGVSRFDSTL